MNLFTALIALSFIMTISPAYAQNLNKVQVNLMPSSVPNAQLQHETKFNIAGYIVSKKPIAYIVEKDQLIAPSIQIIGNNGVVFEINTDPERISFTKIFFGTDGGEAQELPVDLEGNGSNFLIMSTFSGGVNCCYNYYLISLLTEKIEVRQVINAFGSNVVFEKQADGKPYVLKVNDTTMVDFYLNEKEAYQPQITLTYDESTKTFEPNFNFLKQTFSNSIFEGIKKVTIEAVEKTQKEYGSLDIILKPIVINASRLAYSGNFNLAKKLIDAAWPKNFVRIRKEKFIEQFTCRLKTSPYYNELKKDNTELDSAVNCTN